MEKADKETEIEHKASAYSKSVVAAMGALREVVDAAEQLVAKKHWSLPTYAELLFGVI
ncbi:MAG TPA: hypothetical protein PKY53_02050 [Clostridia bacterium]|nr:hypothetical protein [Clostridia bacterium]